MSDPVALFGTMVPGTAGSFNWGGLAASIVGIVAIVKTALSSVIKVQTGERGVCTKFGKLVSKNNLPKTVQPGLHFVWPFTHNILKVSVQKRTSDLGDVVFESHSGPTGQSTQWSVHCKLMWQVCVDPESLAAACFATDNLDEVVVAIGRAGVRDTYSSTAPVDLESAGRINDTFCSTYAAHARLFGAELLALLPGSLGRTPSQVLADLLLVPGANSVNGKLSVIHSVSSQ